MCKLNPLSKVSKCNNKSKCKTYFNYQYGMNTITCIGTLWNMQLKQLHLILPYLLKNVCLLLMCQLVKEKNMTNSRWFPTGIAYSKIMLQLLFDIFNLMNQFFSPFHSWRLLNTLSSQSTKH